METEYQRHPEHDEWEERSWIPSIHMRKEAARIWLRVIDVRLERFTGYYAEGR